MKNNFDRTLAVIYARIAEIEATSGYPDGSILSVMKEDWLERAEILIKLIEKLNEK